MFSPHSSSTSSLSAKSSAASKPNPPKTKTPMLLSPPNTAPFPAPNGQRTPPPTLPSSPSFHTPSFASKAFLPEDGYPFPPIPAPPTPRRRLWPPLLIPLVLFLIAGCTRWMRHPAVIDLVVGSEDGSLLGIHKRHPSASISFPTPSSTSASTSTSPSASTSPSNQPVPTIPSSASPPPLPTPFPQPWDQSSLSLNFSTQGCYNFFLNMTNADSFRSCRSFGMLQSFSDSFVDAQTNVTLLNEVLWGTCNPPDGADTCTNTLRDWVDGIMASCGQEWDERNEIVVQTRVALLAYPLLLSTSCLPLSNTNTYCYVSSIAQGPSSVSDIYLYSLPLGIPFPDSAKPSCGPCERDLLGSFGSWLNSTSFSTTSSATTSDTDPTLDPDDTSPAVGLKKTYADAVQVVEGVCGEGFVTSGSTAGGSGPVGSHASGARGMSVRGRGVLGLMLVAVGVVQLLA
ncbi:hypothetical protein D9758_017054 [Tetrapyrgos nigripes]|uniref:DUF7729 domain-containing protein n=1 Tax=Tetrapyrgos nigripes TaxID=182062 RepID=A0A8H5CLS7_9AGAR|nr:hypothetical protein D9758_017054 [Tetrapyrgos nigripes]